MCAIADLGGAVFLVESYFNLVAVCADLFSWSTLVCSCGRTFEFSGLSELTLLVEAREKSGSLITARLAVEQGRDACAVPGPATTPLSVGCHRMISQGAVLVIRVAEVAEDLGWSLARSANVT